MTAKVPTSWVPMRWKVVVAALAALIGATLGIGFWQLSLPTPTVVADQPDKRQEVMDAARDHIVKILTYQAATISEDTRAATELTTGDFRSYYERFRTDVVIPSAARNGVNTAATVRDVGVESLSEDRAAVIAFVDQSTTSYEKPDPQRAANAVRVVLRREHGAWLVAELKHL